MESVLSFSDARLTAPRDIAQLLDTACTLLHATIDLSPHTSEIQTYIAYTKALQAGFAKLCRLSRPRALPFFPAIFGKLSEGLLSNRSQVITATTSALIGLVKAGMEGEASASAPEQKQQQKQQKQQQDPVEQVWAQVEALLGYRFKAEWTSSCAVVKALFAATPRTSAHMAAGLLGLVDDMYKTAEEEHKRAILDVCGACVRVFVKCL